jgi:hypothetical protein
VTDKSLIQNWFFGVSIEVDELSTSSRAVAKAMEMSYVTCSDDGWHSVFYRLGLGYSIKN